MVSNTPEYVQVLTTVDSEDSGAQLARGAIDGQLAACVQIIGPIKSVYRWRGSVEEAREWQLLAKTTADLVHQLQEYIKANHSYDTPEIIVMPITSGNPAYLSWISEETGRADAS